MSRLIGEGLTFDDISVVPIGHKINIEEINLESRLTKKIKLKAPIISCSMDTVTESRMAINVARQGGLGIIHNKMTIERQVSEVDRVKRSENGVITDPFYLSPNHYVYEAEQLIIKYKISGVPIVESGLLVGIITNRDLKFEDDHNKKIYEVMTRDDLITAPFGTSLEEANEILKKHKVEKLPLVDEHMNLKGLITIKDIKKPIKYPNSAKDALGRLLVGAEVSLEGNYLERIDKLVNAKVDVLFIETVNDYSDRLVEGIKKIKEKYSDIEIVAGNVITEDGARKLVEAGVDGIKVGIGAGSINVTRVITGVGIPQITAIDNCLKGTKGEVPLIIEGGIKYSGDIVKALSAGADVCVLGYLLAGCYESPGDIELYKGRKYKNYCGIKADDTIKDSNNTPEALDAKVPYTGHAKDVLDQILGGVRTGLSYAGVGSAKELVEKGKYVKITKNGGKEAHINNIFVSKESANYSVERF